MKELRKENQRLRESLEKHREIILELLDHGSEYTGDTECVFCSGWPDYVSATDTEDGEIIHSEHCPAKKAEVLLGREGA